MANLFDPGIDRRGIKPRLRIIGTWEPTVRSAMFDHGGAAHQ